MSYSVKVHTKEEKERYWERVKEKGESVAEIACFTAERECVGPFGGAYVKRATFDLGFGRPKTNLISEKDWGLMLAQAVSGCRRIDSEGRGLSRDEFEMLLNSCPTRLEVPIGNSVVRSWKKTEINAVRRHLGWK